MDDLAGVVSRPTNFRPCMCMDNCNGEEDSYLDECNQVTSCAILNAPIYVNEYASGVLKKARWKWWVHL
jgi:hypothetical protein